MPPSQSMERHFGRKGFLACLSLRALQDGDTVDCVVTGSWSKKAAGEAKKYCKVNIVATGDNKSIPPAAEWKLSPEAK